MRPHRSTPSRVRRSDAPPVDDPLTIVALILAAYPLIRDGIISARHLLNNRAATRRDESLAAALLTDIDRVEANSTALRQFLARNNLDHSSRLDPGVFASSLSVYEQRKFADLVDECLTGVRTAFRHATRLSGKLEAIGETSSSTSELRETVTSYNQLRFSETYSKFFDGVESLSRALRLAMSDLGLMGPMDRRKGPPPKPSEGPDELREDLMAEARDALEEKRRLIDTRGG